MLGSPSSSDRRKPFESFLWEGNLTQRNFAWRGVAAHQMQNTADNTLVIARRKWHSIEECVPFSLLEFPGHICKYFIMRIDYICQADIPCSPPSFSPRPPAGDGHQGLHEVRSNLHHHSFSGVPSRSDTRLNFSRIASARSMPHLVASKSA